MTGEPIARVKAVSHRYGATVALNDVSIDIPARIMVGVIGPDGVGKSTLLGLIAGVRKIQTGEVVVFDKDVANSSNLKAIRGRIAYMPQGLGRNLYPTLSVFENIDFFGRLFGQGAEERRARITELLTATAMEKFEARPAGKLSGGMKQKLSLCCALINDPDLLILDEPTTGVDPLSRGQFWDLINSIRARRPQMSVVVATAYMDEAERFDWLMAMDDGKIIATGTLKELLAKTGEPNLDEAFIAMMPEAKRALHKKVVVRPRVASPDETPAIEAEGLTRRFGDFVAVDHVELQDSPRRDLRLSRFERLRQVDDHENARRLPAGDQRHLQAVRRADGLERHASPPKRRLHDPSVLALWRIDGRPKPRPARAALSFAERQGRGPDRGPAGTL